MGSSTGLSEAGSTDEATIVVESTAVGRADDGLDLGEGDTFGRYVILDELGRGGMGRVLRAYDPKLRREIALKLMHIRSADATDGEVEILREAQAMAQLSHPNVVPVFDVDTARGTLFIAMEYVAGQTLREWCAQETRSWRAVLAMFIDAGKGLAAAHDAGLIHRDFKPSNVLVGEDGRVRVTDFGLARGVDLEMHAKAGHGDGSDAATQRTTAGIVMGTPVYMAPEQHAGEELSAASDQYSFCVALFQALYGTLPFAKDDMQSLADRKVRREVEAPPSDARVPRALHRVVLRGLEAGPSERWPSMDALLGELVRRRDRGRKLWMAGGAAGVGALALSGWIGGPASSPCDAGDDRIGEVWGASKRGAIESAILGVGAQYTEGTWGRVDAGLESYAERWRVARRDACEATQVRHEQSAELLDLRMACLDTKLAGLDALVEVLADADEDIAREAVTAVASLPSLDPCSDPEQLRAPFDPPPKEQEEAVVAVRTQIARSNALDSAGRFADARELAEKTAELARSTGYDPVVAEALSSLGWKQSADGLYAEARDTTREAYFLALRVGHLRVASVSASRLVFIFGERLQDADEAFVWAEHAEALLDSAHAPPSRRAEFLYNLGTVHNEKRDGAKSQEILQRAVAIRESIDPPDLDGLANDLNALASSHHVNGDYEGARDLYQRSLQIYTDFLGADHPKVAAPMTNLATTLFFLGEVEQSTSQLQEALEIQRAGFGPDHPKVALTLGNLGAIHSTTGELELAREELEQVVGLWERRVGPKHANYAIAIGNLGSVLDKMGNTEEGIEHLERAIGILEAVGGPDDPRPAQLRGTLGDVYLRAGRIDDAERAFQKTLDALTRSFGDSHPRVGSALENLARVAAAREQPGPAIDFYRKALAVYGGSQARPIARATAEFGLAKVLWDRPDDRVEAVALATQARQRLEDSPGQDPEALAEVETWLSAHRP